MASAASSSSSSVTPAQLIDKILTSNTDEPDFDLSLLVKQIDDLLAHNGTQLRKKNPVLEKLGEYPFASDASNIAEQVSTNMKLIASEIKEHSGSKHETSIAVLNAIGNVHWIAVGFLVVGAVLKIAHIIENNKKKCFTLLKSMNDLAKVILRLKCLPSLDMDFHSKLKDSINLIVDGAILCCSQRERKGCFKRVFKASTDGQELQQLNEDINEMFRLLSLHIGSCNLESNLVISPAPVPPLNNDAVGIEENIEEVIQQLDWENDSKTTAVIVYGLGGSGKTTLADAVYASLKERLQGWRHSKVILIENLEKDPNVENLQLLILQDLTSTRHIVRGFESRGQNLKDIIEKEPVFLYIDNVLYLEPLKKLLPNDIRSAKKFRLLLTARDTAVSGVVKGCGVGPCKLYQMKPLSVEAALQILCRNIDIERGKESILKERSQAKKIAEKCNCCPLILPVIGAYLRQRRNRVEAYDRVLNWIQTGEAFSGSQNYSFDEQRVLFSYEVLQSSAKEAFLDLCFFFYHRKWEEVACIVGEEEMECLQDGALIRREDEWIKIHDLILTAGRNKLEHPRLKNVEDFSPTLSNKKLTSQTKGVWMESDNSPSVISVKALDAMSRSLRVLYMGRMTSVEGTCRKHFHELRFLHVERGVSNLPINIFNLKNLRYLSINGFKEDIILSPSMKLPNLNVLGLSWCRIHGIAEIAHLHSLKKLDLSGCNTDGISQCFSNLHNLQKLKLSYCKLTELPKSLVKLRSLEEMDLSNCSNLKQLPAGFGELVSLTVLDLSYCSSLQELPSDLENLTSLQSLEIDRCRSLTRLPILGGLMSVWGSNINFDGCSSLSELPEEICKHTMLTSISLGDCSNLKMLPSKFGELTCLLDLNLAGCESLQKLCDDFHCLVGLRALNLSSCKRLSSLPLGFGNLSTLKTLNLSNCESLACLPEDFQSLSSLEILDLSGCDKLQELCSGFHCLVALKNLNLSKCDRLRKLPDCFGKLSCLEILDLSGCSNLVKLSDDFYLLRTLTRLNLSKCENLGGEWMDVVESIKSFWFLDIVLSETL